MHKQVQSIVNFGTGGVNMGIQNTAVAGGANGTCFTGGSGGGVSWNHYWWKCRRSRWKRWCRCKLSLQFGELTNNSSVGIMDWW